MRNPVVVFGASLALTGCFGFSTGEMTSSEALEAMSQAFESSSGEQATTEVVEVTTDFTIGDAVADAAEELRAWWETQVPCATAVIDVSSATVTVDFGDLTDNCEYNGHTYGGVYIFQVVNTTLGTLEVGHEWQDFTNGDTTVNGTADVTWAGGEDPSREVVHELTWTNSEGDEVVGNGDRTQTFIDPTQGLVAGIEVNGTRNWLSDDELWALSIDGVEMRAQDPVPQDGVYTLSSPADKQLTLSFERQDEDTIRVTVTGIRGGIRAWDVTASGQIEEEVDLSEEPTS